MELLKTEWLRAFVILAECNSFKDAAAKLGVTQQALSKIISRLEANIGTTLIQRQPKWRGLTLEGQAFLTKASILLQNIHHIQHEFVSDSIPQGPLKIAVPSAVDTIWLPNMLFEFVRQYPHIRPECYTLRFQDAEKWLRNGELDLALLMHLSDKDELVSHKLFDYRMLIVGVPQPVQPWHELTYIAPKQWHHNTESITTWPENEFPRKIVFYAQSLLLLLELCEKGVGAVFVPETIVQDRLQQGRLAIIADPPRPFQIPLYLVWNKNIHLRSSVKALQAHMLKGLPDP